MKSGGWWQGKAVLITGASSGLGAALALALAEAGAFLLVTARSHDRLAAIAQQPNVHACQADLTTHGVAQTILDALDRTFGKLDVLINNAGIQSELELVGADPDAFMRQARAEVEVNLVAPLELTLRAIPLLLRSPAPVVVNIGSGLAFAPKASAPVYSATKAALRALSFAVGFQGRRTTPPIRTVHVVLPMIDTPMTHGRGTGKMAADDAANAILAGVASGKMEIHVGKARLLPWLLRAAPDRAVRLFAGS